MLVRERWVDGLSAGLFLLVAVLIARFLPSERGVEPLLVVAIVLAYPLVSRVRFEFANSYVSPEQIVFMAMLVLLPLPFIPLLVALAGVLATLPEVTRRTWHRERWVTSISDSWFSIGPVLVLAALAPGEAALGGAEFYLLAFAAQLAGDFCWNLIRARILLGHPALEVLRTSLQTAQVDAVLAPLGFTVALLAVDEPLALLAVAPLVWLLELFSRDRTARYTATLELNRAYRGTVMMLSDVIEFDDAYTGDHSRSVVDLVRSVGEQMNVPAEGRQELEFAALLHDVGKISIPKEILNKPAALSDAEFEIIKTHTIEGQFMLDRIGGLLGRVGEIVRSCHERWDGRGYPDGLHGEEIPLPARIVFGCDAFNAMTTDRPYRAAMPRQAALKELSDNAGGQFDPEVVAALCEVVNNQTPTIATSANIRALLSAAGAQPPAPSVRAAS